VNAEITFWLNILSPHVVGLLRSLAIYNTVAVATTIETPRQRLKLGWKQPELSHVELHPIASADDIRRISAGQSRAHLNIIGGLRGMPFADCIIETLRLRRSRLGVLSERPDLRGIGGFGKRLVYKFAKLRLCGSVDFILAMGRLGESAFVNFGWPAEKVYPFAYTSGSTVCKPAETDCSGRPFRILFVGQFIQRKGGDVLLRALARMTDLSWTCVFVGAGDMEEEWKWATSELGLSDRVRFLPPVAIERVGEVISGADLLVLPSYFDGWGAVVNESLMAGVPAICSEGCGARDLIDGKFRGDVFLTGDDRDLSSVLRRWVEMGPAECQERLEIQEWANRITGGSVARYFEQIVHCVYHAGPRPVAPWLA
jgi:glycosyltransferase involved in cell wall biosynthesis